MNLNYFKLFPRLLLRLNCIPSINKQIIFFSKTIANPADPLKLEIIFKRSMESAYSEKNSSFFGTIYPSIL